MACRERFGHLYMLGKSRETLHQAVDIASGLKLVQSTEGRDDPLLGGPIFPEIFHDLKVLPGTRFLDTNEHD